MYLLGYDLGSSSIKASLIDSDTGECSASSVSPQNELEIIVQNPQWAEQSPEIWWENVISATHEVLKKAKVNKEDIAAIGIGYQMHGLVVVDSTQKVLRNAIIWCDSRAVDIGVKAFNEVGKEKCLKRYLNSPGNFTASKLKWVQSNEKHIYKNIYKIMLPGDYIAMKLSGEITTTSTGLSEAILWDYEKQDIAYSLLEYFEIEKELLPSIVPTFSVQCRVSKKAAQILGLQEGTPVTYRAGDQPNNALSLNVLKPGEIAATAGTSGVVYGIADKPIYDPNGLVNTFIHVNNSAQNQSYGILMCLNGTGILYSWLKRNFYSNYSYNQMNEIASKIEIGAENLTVLPYGNGAERTLDNLDINASVHGLKFNVHTKDHILRASIEGIAFGFKYGLEKMESMGISVNLMKAGYSNLFLCPVFAQTLANIAGVQIELYNTDGSVGAARGAGFGSGIYKDFENTFKDLKTVAIVKPKEDELQPTHASYKLWKKTLINTMDNEGSSYAH